MNPDFFNEIVQSIKRQDGKDDRTKQLQRIVIPLQRKIKHVGERTSLVRMMRRNVAIPTVSESESS